MKMKKMLLLFCMTLITGYGFSQSTRLDTAKVSKVLGVPVFVMCEPIASYEIVSNVSDDDAVSIMNAVGGENTYRTIKESCKVIVTNAQRKQKKGKFTFDAIIISDDGHNGTCIKFTKQEQ